MKTDQNTLTEGVIWKKLLFFAMPILLGNIFQQMYNTADALIVGRFLDKAALAAVTSSGSLIFMMVGFFNGIAMGAGVVIAKYFGAKDERGVSLAVHTDVAFGLVAGVILTVLGVAFTPTILQWMKTPDNVLPNSIMSVSYTHLYPPQMGPLPYTRKHGPVANAKFTTGPSWIPTGHLILTKKCP